MNTLRITFKEFKQQIRDWRSNAIMILFPIILMTILGAALSGAFSGMTSLPEIKATYTLEGAGPVAAAFSRLASESAVKGVQFSEAPSKEEGIQSVENADSSAYLVVDNRRIELYRNERYPVESGIVKSIVEAFLLRYNAVAAVVESQGGPGVARRPDSSSLQGSVAGSYVESRALSGKRTPTATDFYAVTMLTLILMYASLFGASRARAERRLGTADRIVSAPVGRAQLLVGKVLGSLITLMAQAAVLIVFSRYVLGAYWGTHLLTIGVLVVAESVMIVSVGVAVAYLLPSEGATAAVLNTIIPFFAFFGGAYVPLDMMGPAVQRIGAYSPVKWLNQALLGVIYDGDFSAVGHALAINLGAAALFIAVAAIFARREAYR